MSSKSYNLVGPSYGSLDACRADEEKPPAPVAAQPSIDRPEADSNHTPPKPAVRHRSQQSRQSAATQSEQQITGNHKQLLDELTQNIESRMNRSSGHTGKDANGAPDGHQLDSVEASKGSLVLPLPLERGPDQQKLHRPYPKKVLFIVGNEFCERFSYYGLRTVLVLYFRNVLGYSDAGSTVSFHLFASLCYLTPILGAILGDSVWGRFRTILYLSIVYFLGESVLVISSVIWDRQLLSSALTFAGLFLIGIGTGGIKPCVIALGGDQFLAHEERWRQNFFSLFYGAINLGSFLSMFLTPILRSNFNCVGRNDCYPYAFGLPCLLMLASIVVFLLAQNRYVLVPVPEKNVILAFCQCVWLALKRKLSGHKLARASVMSHGTQSDSTSSSNVSLGSSNDDRVSTEMHPPQSDFHTMIVPKRPVDSIELQSAGYASQPTRDHWLYLASDRFDARSIEDFRSVLGILLLFLPTPLYWCLFDQQGSLWTLQATRMDGRIPNTGLVLQPDQMSVANPLLLLLSIPLFQLVIYPSLTRCNLLTRPIQRMTAGGLLAALTFVVSALIEVRIQQFMPLEAPAMGKASLLLVNGLSDCSLASPTISHIQIPGLELMSPQNSSDQFGLASESHPLASLEPLSSKSIDLISANEHLLNNYNMKFKLSDAGPLTAAAVARTTVSGCSLNTSKEHEFSIGPLPDRSAKLLYLEQGNGRLSYKLFNDSLVLPPVGRARVRLIFEAFGSITLAEKREFSLVRLADARQDNATNSKVKFQLAASEGQVLVSKHLDIPVPSAGERFVLHTNDQLVGPANLNSFLLEPSTRNLLLVHQRDATHVEISHQLLQDNKYRISILYQLVPYLLISLSEVMFSITILEFSYAMAPDNMKSVILGAASLTTAFGNILTVAIESVHPFTNIVHDFIFYAALMTVDMFIFAIIGYHFKPYKSPASNK